MSLTDLTPTLTSAFSQEIAVEPVAEGRAQVFVPFYFQDGDGLVVHLHELGDGDFEITDRGHTFLHLGYHTEVDRLRKGVRGDLLERIRARHRIEDRDGELVARAGGDRLGTAVFSFVQGLMEISDLRNLDREIVKSTFKEDLEHLLTTTFAERLTQRYVDHDRDPQRNYEIPYLLNDVPRPVAIFDIATDAHVSQALVVARQHRDWGARLHLVAVERDQTELSRKPVAWLSDAFDKQFSALSGNEAAITTHLEEQYEVSRRLAASS